MLTAVLTAVLVACVATGAAGAGSNCTAAPAQRDNCGYVGITESECTAKGCCWAPVSPNPHNYPWCFAPTPPPAPPAPPPSGPPFTPAALATMKAFLRANLNIGGLGGVAASPDKSVGYYYAWCRDAALSMRTWMLHAGDSPANTTVLFDAYSQWVLRAQAQADPNGIDIRAEPKYNLPHANVYTGGWCRPQQDGPGLRATALMLFAEDLLASGGSAYVAEYLWTGSQATHNGGAIKYDLDYAVTAWESNGCDPWENVQNTAIFWVRYNTYHALVKGAAFASKMGDSASAATYAAAAAKCLASLPSFWNGDFIIEQTNRELDAAVVLALNTAYLGLPGEEAFAPTAPWVVATAKVLSAYFESEFAINSADTARGLPGILWGRFEGDTFFGGNPWILCTAGYAELLYRGAAAVVANGMPSAEALAHYAGLLDAPDTALADLGPAAFARLLVSTGDGVLYRLRFHVEPLGYDLPEELGRNTGAPMSATSLSWSFANVIRAMAARDAWEAAAAQTRSGAVHRSA